MDFRTRAFASVYDLEESFTMDKYRHIWRGVRWLSANLLSWNERFILPEDLDYPEQVIIQNQRLLK